MTGKTACQVCGATLTPGAPEGLCPACLLGAGLDQAAPQVPDEVDLIAEKPGDLVGRYRLVEKIGEGGFGVVFHAEQEKPVRRVVALKVIKPGMDSREVVTRFEAERQALAMMDHPNIAKVYDAGTTERGRPYFVMELVEGEPLTDYCDAHRLGMPERLMLFSHICVAVQHAHQKGVIHRDLKPSNILIAEAEDGSPVAKIIDFGVAKAISIELTEKTFFTMFGRMVGTPQDMSPEQAELNAVDVDTRSDIYSLGVVLYELVTGCAPLAKNDLTAVSFDEMRRMIREVEPLKPSARVFNLPDDERREVSEVRGIDPARIRRYIAGDLDWVVMRALEKDRNRRYDTAHGLALDIRRFLKNLPVTAGPPGAAYRVRKFVRRHRGWVAASVLILLALIGAYFWNLQQRKELLAEKDRTGLEWNKKEYERLKLLVEGVKNRRAEVPGTREAVLEDIGEVGHYHLDEIGLDERAQRSLRDAARNELIASLAWTDLQAEQLPVDLEEPFVRAALDSSHGRCVLAFPGDGRIEVRDARTGATLDMRPGTGEAVEGPQRFSPDGSLVAMGFGTAAQWKLLIRDWREGRDLVKSVPGVHAAFDFHPDGRRFVVGTSRNTLQIFDAGGAAPDPPVMLSGTPLAIRFNRDGEFMAVGMEDSVVVVGTATGTIEDQWDGSGAASLAWASDHRALAVGGADGSVTVLERGPLRQGFKVTEHNAPVDRLAWSRDGLLIASGSSRDRVVILWDARQGKMLCRYPAWARTLSFAEDDRSLGPVLSASNGLSVLEVQPVEACHRAVGHREQDIRAVVWSADALILATAAADGLRLWNREGLELAHFKDIRVNPGGLTRSRDQLYIAAPDGIWRLPIRITGGRLDCGKAEHVREMSGAMQIKLSPDGRSLAVACGTEVILVNPADGEVQDRLPAPASTAYLAFSPDGHWLAAGTHQGQSVRVWPLPAGQGGATDIAVGRGATVAFFPLTHHPRTNDPLPPFLMTGDAGFYRLWTWSADAGSWIQVCKPHPSEMANPRGRMAQMVFSPRGTAVAVSYDRKTLQILNPVTLELMSQPGFDEQWPLALSPDGRMMTTESSDGLFIWNLEMVRKELFEHGLDWTELGAFPPQSFPIVQPQRAGAGPGPVGE